MPCRSRLAAVPVVDAIAAIEVVVATLDLASENAVVIGIDDPLETALG